MKMISPSFKTKMTYALGGVLATLILVSLTDCKGGKGGEDPNDRVRVDTVVVTKTITIPEIKEVFVDRDPEVVTVVRPDEDLLAKYQALNTEHERLKAYADAVTKRYYSQTYVSNDSLVQVTVNDSVTGTLDFQSVNFVVAPREVEYQERQITKTIEKYPDFILSAGAGVQAPLEPGGAFSFEAALRARTGRGWNYEVGYNTSNELRLTLTKDIFVKH